MSNTFERFKQFLLDSFGDGVYVRELRLSHEELGYVKTIFPNAEVHICPDSESADGKQWYNVHLKSANPTVSGGDKHKVASIQVENDRLKKELAMLKKELSTVSDKS